jgi:glycosyltransferase involved in cell wall biosynthesis
VKVLFVNPVGELGGAERVLLDLIGSLKEFAPSLEASVLSFAPGPLLEEAALLGAKTSVLPLPQSATELGDAAGIDAVRSIVALSQVFAWAPGLARRLAAEGADVIHTNGLKAHALVALTRPKGVPLAWHLHDFISIRPLMSRVLPMLRSRAAIAIAVSEAVATDARTVLAELPVVTVLNGVRTADYARANARPADLDSLAGLPTAPPGTTRVGLIAAFATWKGHELFLQAANKLRGYAARFYLVGAALYSTSGSQRTLGDLRRRILELGLADRVGIVPFQRETASVYAALDIVAHASTKPEPFGLVVAEGLSAGRAVVAAASGGILEQIVDGETGLLFPMGDSYGLAERIERLLRSPSLRRTLGTAGAHHARAHLDASRLGPETYRLYERVLGEGIRRPALTRGR